MLLKIGDSYISDRLSTGVDGRFGGDSVGDGLGHGGADEDCKDGETHLDFLGVLGLCGW